MTAQPRDLAAEVEAIKAMRRLGQEYGTSGTSYIDTLLQHIAALSRELEEMRKPAIAPASPEVERLRTENERLTKDLEHANKVVHQYVGLWDEAERQLTALRRPVEQSDAAEAVFKLMRPYDTFFLWNDPRLRELIQKWCEPLLCALESTARQLRERVEMLSVVQDALSERNRERVELRERIERLEGALRQIRDFPVCDRGALVDACKRALAAAESPIPVRGKSLAQQCIEDELKPKEQQRWP